MSRKFGKYREVDNRYLNVPLKYMTNYYGKNTDGHDIFCEENYEEWYKRQNEFINRNPIFKEYIEVNKETYNDWKKNNLLQKVLVKKGTDKTLCIVDFYGKDKALVGWRNNNTCKMGMTHICKIIWKNKKPYLDYKGKLILINNSGWVW